MRSECYYIPAIARVIIIYLTSLTQVNPFSMTWKATWQDILNGGAHRWKVDDISAKQKALDHILDHTESNSLKILCPLAGDDRFVHYAWSQGHDVTAIDIVPEALEAMRCQFGDAEDWSSSTTDEGVVWKHKSGRAILYEGDITIKRGALINQFDAIYDKDSFGALNLNVRSIFCERLSDYIKDNGTLYIEVKNKNSGRDQGPPFHVEKEDLMEPSNFGKCFEHIISLGEVYQLNMPTAIQTGHVLRRLVRK